MGHISSLYVTFISGFPDIPRFISGHLASCGIICGQCRSHPISMGHVWSVGVI